MKKSDVRIGILNAARVRGVGSAQVLEEIASATKMKLRTDSVRGSINQLVEKFRAETVKVIADIVAPKCSQPFAIESARLLDTASLKYTESNATLFKRLCTAHWYAETGFQLGVKKKKPKRMPRKLFNKVRNAAKMIRAKMRRLKRSKVKIKTPDFMDHDLERFLEKHMKAMRVPKKFRPAVRDQLIKEMGYFIKVVGEGKFKKALRVVMKTPKVYDKFKGKVKPQPGASHTASDVGGYFVMLAGIGSATVLLAVFISIYWKALLGVALIAIAATLLALIVRTIFKFTADSHSKLKRRIAKRLKREKKDGGISDEKKAAAREEFLKAKKRAKKKKEVELEV